MPWIGPRADAPPYRRPPPRRAWTMAASAVSVQKAFARRVEPLDALEHRARQLDGRAGTAHGSMAAEARWPACSRDQVGRAWRPSGHVVKTCGSLQHPGRAGQHRDSAYTRSASPIHELGRVRGSGPGRRASARARGGSPCRPAGRGGAGKRSGQQPQRERRRAGKGGHRAGDHPRCRRTCKRWVIRVGRSRRACTRRGAPGRPALAQRPCEEVGGRDRVLDGQVDADAADRRHGVRGVADAEEPGPVPARQPVHADGGSSGRPSSRSPPDPVGGNGAGRRRCAEGLEAAAAELLEAALGDDVAALPVLAPMKRTKIRPGRSGPCGLGVAGMSRNAEPQHVHGRAELLHRQPGPLAEDRAPPVGGDHQVGAHLSWPSGVRRVTPTTRPRPRADR